MKRILLILGLINLSAFLNKTIAGDTLFWRNSSRLTWNDFKGKPGKSPTGTGSYIMLDYDLTNDANTFKTKVNAYFLKDISWSQFKNNDTLLQHEQLRFDMAELFARKLRKAFSEYQYNSATVMQDVKKIFNEIKEARLAMNELYNKETKYATDWNAQQAWNQKISAELDKLSNFAE